VRIEFQPDRIIVGDRAYYRPLFGAVTFPSDSPLGYVLVAGELYRPTEFELDGRVDTPQDIEPFRSVVNRDQESPWRYTEDVVLEVLDERLCSNLRELQEAICDFSEKYRTAYFYCSAKQRDAAFRSAPTLVDIMNRRIAIHKKEDWRFNPRVGPPSVMPISARDREFLEGTVRSLVSMGRLLFNSECRHVLSENPLALEALSVAAFVGTAYRLRTTEEEPKKLVDTYQMAKRR